MSERIPTTAQGRLANFNRGNPAFEKAARKRYIDEALGDAGVTDFSDAAKQRLEDQAKFDAYMKKFATDTRDSDDRHREAVDSGEIKSNEDPRRHLLARRIAVLANDILKMEADGHGDRAADNKGKTVLDYRKERLQELQDEYDYSVDYNQPTDTSKKQTEAEATVESTPSNETNETTESEDASTTSESKSPNSSEKVSASEQHDDSDPYQVGKEVIVQKWLHDEDAGEYDSAFPPEILKATIVSKSDDGKLFSIKLPDGTVEENITSKSLDAWKTVPIKEYERNPDGSLNHSKPLGWKKWTITAESRPEDGDWAVRLTDGDKTIVRPLASLELWNHTFANEVKDRRENAPQPTSETSGKTPETKVETDEDKGLNEWLGTLPETKKSEAEPATPALPDAPSVKPFKNKRTKESLEKISPKFANKLETYTAASRRAFTRKNATVAGRTKSKRQVAKQLIVDGLGGRKVADRYAGSRLSRLNRAAATQVGRALRLNKTPKEIYNKRSVRRGLARAIRAQQKSKENS